VSEIPKDRYALIIGSMKCATTSLFSYLAEHPAIAPAKIKEPEFFSRNQGHQAKLARYEDLWDFDPDIHRYAMEASTGYSKWGERGAAERIHAYGLRPRLVYVVRDPFARIESHYNFMLQNPAWTRGHHRREPGSDLELLSLRHGLRPDVRPRQPDDSRLRGADLGPARDRQPGLRLSRPRPGRGDRRSFGPQRHRPAEVLSRAPSAPAGARHRPRCPGVAETPAKCSRRSAPTSRA
jgi:hypothetical protein